MVMIHILYMLLLSIFHLDPIPPFSLRLLLVCVNEYIRSRVSDHWSTTWTGGSWCICWYLPNVALVQYFLIFFRTENITIGIHSLILSILHYLHSILKTELVFQQNDDVIVEAFYWKWPISRVVQGDMTELIK